MCTSMIKEFMSSVLKMAEEVKIEKTDCFVEYRIFSIADRTEQIFPLPIKRTAKDYSSVEL